MKATWTHIISIGKVLAVLAIVVKGALWIDGKFDASNDKLDDIQQTVDYNSIELSMQSEQIQGIHDTLGRMEANGAAREQKIETIAWGLNHINQFTPEDFEEIMDEMLKKKELVRIYPEWPEELTVQPTTSLRSMR